MTAPDIATPSQRTTFLSILAAIEPGTVLSANLLHEDAHKAAQLPPNALGGLFGGAERAGYIFHVGFTRASDPAAKGRWIKAYERAAKTIPPALVQQQAAS